MYGNTVQEKINRRECPCCGSKLVSDGPCIDNKEKEWISCPSYPHCPTRMVVDRIVHYQTPFGRIVCTRKLQTTEIFSTDINRITCEGCHMKQTRRDK
jgi:ssDNA-binding Zn-finger/Zn-ribbon topoisomerase 1